MINFVIHFLFYNIKIDRTVLGEMIRDHMITAFTRQYIL